MFSCLHLPHLSLSASCWRRTLSLSSQRCSPSVSVMPHCFSHFSVNLVVRSGARLRPPELSVEGSSSSLGLGSCSRTRTPGASSLAHRTFRSSSLLCRPSRSRRSHTICWGFCEFEGSGNRYAVAVSTSALPSIPFPPRNIPIPLPLPLSLLKITPLQPQVRPLSTLR